MKLYKSYIIDISNRVIFDNCISKVISPTENVSAAVSPEIWHAAYRPTKLIKTRMWDNAQRDGLPAEYRWRPLFNAAKFG